MGFKIKLRNISVTNDFRVFYRKGRTPGSSTIQSGNWEINGGVFVGDFVSSVNSVDIDIENIEYGSQYWVKILDVVTGSYIIENVYVHEFEFYRFCETCCDLSGGTATFISFDVDCTFTGGSAIFESYIPTPTPTSTPTLKITSTNTTNPTNQEGNNGTAIITYSGGTNPVTCTINGVSGGSVSSGSVTFNNLLGNTVYTVIITDANNNTDQVTFTLGQTSFTFDVDYLMITYEFTDGTDLDTRTRIVTPDVGQNTQNKYIGWGLQSQWPENSDSPYLTWGGDNQGIGFESVLLDLTKFVSLYPSTTELILDLRSFWFGNVGVNLVNAAATLWRGGLPVENGYMWSNPTAINTYNISSVGTIITDSGRQTDKKGQRVATLKYNLLTNQGLLDNNDTITPSI